MYQDYESIKETLAERVVDVKENYIKKALEELGYNQFPESGLNEEGKNRLIERTIDIQEREASLIPKKIEKPKKNSENLESQVMKEELNNAKEILGFIGGGITKLFISLGTNLAFRVPFALPTYIRRHNKWWTKHEPSEGLGESIFQGGGLGLLYNIFLYAALSDNKKIVLPLILTQLTSNTISGIYEWKRHVKKKAKCLSCFEYSNYSPNKVEEEDSCEPRCKNYGNYKDYCPKEFKN